LQTILNSSLLMLNSSIGFAANNSSFSVLNPSSMHVLLPSSYLAPVEWYWQMNRSERCLVEHYDNFQKQTYRNRCLIATTSGVQALVIPVERSHGQKTLTCDIRISDHGSWRHLHWNAICSAYGESAFFDYVADDLRPFYEKRYEFLVDFNADLCRAICRIIDIEPRFEPTSHYINDPAAEGLADYREAIRPKHPRPTAGFAPRPYYQVYAQKFGFHPNLSILDMVMNLGRETALYL